MTTKINLCEIAQAVHEMNKKEARRNLLDFGGLTFPEVESGIRFLRPWFHEVIWEELQKWDTDPDYPFLMFLLPPRHGKSQIISREYPAWKLGKDPDTKIITTSYSADLANEMSRDVQKIMLSDMYSEIFPDTKISHTGQRDETAGRKAAGFQVIAHRGEYISRGVGGAITGFGGDRILIDDPVKNRAEAESKTYRDRVWKWYISTLRTRLQPGGKIALILTRWHEDDVAGRILKQMKDDPDADKWKVVSFPAMFKESEYTHPKDEREEGEALWKEMYPRKALITIKASLGTYDWVALYQQRPAPAGGAYIKRKWLEDNKVSKAPESLTWVRYWDLAVSSKESADFTAGVQMAVDEFGHFFVRKVIHEREEYPQIKKLIKNTSIRERISVGIENQSTQKGLVDDLISDPEMWGVDLRGYPADKDKLTRALPWIARAEEGKLHIAEGAGIDDYIDELVHFTGHNDTYDDQVDCTSGAYRMLQEYEEPISIVIGQYGG